MIFLFLSACRHKLPDWLTQASKTKFLHFRSVVRFVRFKYVHTCCEAMWDYNLQAQSVTCFKLETIPSSAFLWYWLSLFMLWILFVLDNSSIIILQILKLKVPYFCNWDISIDNHHLDCSISKFDGWSAAKIQNLSHISFTLSVTSFIISP